MSEFPSIPGFRCDAELGRGGMAVVYAATDATLGRRVAIKVVSARDDRSAQHVRRLEQEARGLAALQHPNIVELHQFGRTEDGALYYVMPLFEGGDLTRWPKPIAEDRLTPLLRQLLDALAHAHAAGIVHRDIKPGNILFDREGRPRLADFGAAFVRGRSRLTEHGMVVGSSGYMSPEQSRGLAVDARSDLYSLAVLAFELLTGRLPFEGEDDLSIALAKLEQPVPRLPPVHAHWQRFFDQALAVDPARRYANAGAMRAALPAERAPRTIRVSLEPRTRRIAVASALGVLALLALAAVFRGDEADVPIAAQSQTPAAPVVAKRIEAATAPAPRPDTTSSTSFEPGTRFADRGGPALVVALAASGERPALAVMKAAVTPALFERYRNRTGDARIDCAPPAQGVQGCIDVGVAEDLAAWLTRETGARYRLPTRDELEAAAAHVAPVAAHAWSSTCREVRNVEKQNVARRTWSGVRQVFGRAPLRRRVTTRCDGHYTVALDGRGTVELREAANTETTAVLVREMTPEPRPE